ncbi:hypothetical protein CSKR_100291 [Clonorchis sinensis]|uniref:Uncharacterized protein n=2 Tax=Clonorchis sinensis TaxID=79923 RepID=A0A8T1MJI4_CLOSI|nr:hypothetical protein CSKR_100291 [Clonorchis sinensis]GAA48165.1 hypothetical protein CLF_101258 [Clonorchis sinensis]
MVFVFAVHETGIHVLEGLITKDSCVIRPRIVRTFTEVSVQQYTSKRFRYHCVRRIGVPMKDERIRIIITSTSNNAKLEHWCTERQNINGFDRQDAVQQR